MIRLYAIYMLFKFTILLIYSTTNKKEISDILGLRMKTINNAVILS
jgi:hypothetical protein